MTLFKHDRPRPIDRVIDYFGEPRRILAGASTASPTSARKPVKPVAR